MDLVKTGTLLKELRKEKNITQEELADKMGVSRRTVSRWETGSNMPDMAILIATHFIDAIEGHLREFLTGMSMGIGFGMIVVGAVITSKYAKNLREFKMRMLGKGREK